jgi:hypothetical protein
VETRNTGYGGDGGEEDELQKNQYLNNYNDRQMVSSPTTSTAVTVRSPEEVRNKYSQALAQQAGPMASPLPKAELVRKKGYVLSRISFRTIVMKKWKQSFWIQYGSHTMLWFRNESDFDDWLNNPYHTQSQRNFLIKLAVNFVHDLYKPNVRGYQVTQCRTKPYGNKVVRQFKLERWMDYGPTIAAAFGSYDPKEVDACREAIVECMKNTPLDNGIRATGAVKEYHERQQAALEEQRMRQEQQRQNGGDGGRYQNYQLPDGYRNANGGRGKFRCFSKRYFPCAETQRPFQQMPSNLIHNFLVLQTLNRWMGTDSGRVILDQPHSPWPLPQIYWVTMVDLTILHPSLLHPLQQLEIFWAENSSQLPIPTHRILEHHPPILMHITHSNHNINSNFTTDRSLLLGHPLLLNSSQTI